MLSELFDTLTQHFKTVLVPTKVDTGDGRTFYNAELHQVKPAHLECLQLSTLDGISEYVKGNKDDVVPTNLMAQVVNHQEVVLWGPLDEVHAFRPCVARAILSRTDQFRFGQWLDQEAFSIEVQSKIVDSKERQRLLTLVAAIDVSAGKTVTDSGVAQSIATRAGISMKSEQTVDNPFTVAPYRTFSEIDQPTSPFILRVRQDAGGAPSLALFEADGGKWKLDPIGHISGYLSAGLPKEVSVVA